MLYLRPTIGGLAHLARALAWQARGGRFESDILHKDSTLLGLFYFHPYVLHLHYLVSTEGLLMNILKVLVKMVKSDFKSI